MEKTMPPQNNEEFSYERYRTTRTVAQEVRHQREDGRDERRVI
jgi:hypothetical protein